MHPPGLLSLRVAKLLAAGCGRQLLDQTLQQIKVGTLVIFLKLVAANFTLSRFLVINLMQRLCHF